MSYKIGQLRKNQISSYGQDISEQVDYISNSYIRLPKDTFFKKDNNYYIRFYYTCSNNTSNKATKFLCSLSDGSKKKQPIKYISNVQKYETVIEEGKEVKKPIPIMCELIFTPNDNVYNRIILEQSTNGSPNIVSKKEEVELQEILNVIPRLNNGDVSIVTKVGIQAPIGFMFMLNGEELHVGKSGIYEVEDVNIKNIGFAIKKNKSMPYPDKEDFFIMDYLYN